MKKLTIIILIIIFFILGIILADAVLSGINSIFKTNLTTKKCLDAKLTKCQEDLIAARSVPSPRAFGKTRHSDAQGKIEIKIGANVNVGKYYYMAAVYIPNQDGTFKIYMLDPEVIVDDPPDIDPDKTPATVNITIIKEGDDLIDEWNCPDRVKNHVYPGDKIIWSSIEKTSTGEQIRIHFSLRIIKL